MAQDDERRASSCCPGMCIGTRHAFDHDSVVIHSVSLGNQEVIELLSSFRRIMRHNYETMDVDKIQERWCCNDDPFLFRERWEKIFDDFCETKREKFDPSRVSSRAQFQLDD